MRRFNVFLLLALLPVLALAAEEPRTETVPDSFGLLLRKQAQVLSSEMDAKLNAMQLAGYGQSGIDDEPKVTAIWGMRGREVAEMFYKGHTIPVSKMQPYISKIDGWKLESITAYQVVLVRLDGKKALERKVLMFDWQGVGSGMQRTTSPNSTMSPAIVVPAIQ